MIKEELAFVCCSDISGQVRGKGFPLADLEQRRHRGVGWVPTNIQITAFDSIADSPFGALGDLLLVPDGDAGVAVDFGDGTPVERFFIGDITHTDGTPWACCLRSTLRRALEALRAATGLSLVSAFEHEFQFLDNAADDSRGFSLGGFRAKQGFAEAYVAALRAAGVAPDSFLREWGPDQYEITMHPVAGVAAADHSLLMRELAYATAARRGERISFSPLRGPAMAGNGVHIHMSFRDEDGRPAAFDAAGPGGLSPVAGSFVAGVLKYLPAIVAFTAPSLISYDRLTPHRWSASVNNLGYRDREAAIRICPVAEVGGLELAGQFNFEFRAADAAASPHLQLAAVVFAGVQGIRDSLPAPAATEEDLSLLDDGALAERGLERLPQSLEAALERLAGDGTVCGWFEEPFVDVYLKHKRGEIEHLKDMSEAEIFAAYERVY